jgi:exoribonuclease-2
MGCGNLARGTRVLLRIQGIDHISLDVHGQLIEVLQDASALASDNTAQAQQEDDDETPAGPLAIAVDVDEVIATEAPPA